MFEGVEQGAKAYPIYLMAQLSGIAYGAGVVFDDLINLILNFKEVASQLLQMAAIFYENPELIFEIPGMLADAAAEAQQAQNPFPETELPTSLEDFDLDVRGTVFAVGWYIGGLVGMIGGELLLGMGVVGLANGIASIASKVATLFTSTRAARVLMKSNRAVSAGQKVVGASKWLFDKAENLKYLDPGVLLGKTMKFAWGKRVKVMRLIDELSPSKKQAAADAGGGDVELPGGEKIPLPDGGETLLATYFKWTGDPGKQLLEALPDDVSNLLLEIGVTPGGDAFQYAVVGAWRYGDASSGDIRRMLDAYDGLDPAQRATVRNVITKAGDDGIRAVNRIVDADDVSMTQMLQRMDGLDTSARVGAFRAISDGVDPARVSQSLRRYSDLDPTGDLAAVYGRLLSHSDDTVRNSWLRASGDREVDSSAMETTLDRASTLRANGHQLNEFKVARIVDSDSDSDDLYIDPDSDEFYQEWYDPPRHLGPRPDSIAIDFTPGSKMRILRFFKPSVDGHKFGPWFTDLDDIKGIIRQSDSVAEANQKIRNRYALPEGEGYKAAVFEVDEGVPMRTGTSGPWEKHGLDGGGQEYSIRHRSVKDDTDDLEKSDFPGSWDDDEYSIQEVLNGEVE